MLYGIEANAHHNCLSIDYNGLKRASDKWDHYWWSARIGGGVKGELPKILHVFYRHTFRMSFGMAFIIQFCINLFELAYKSSYFSGFVITGSGEFRKI